MLAGTVNGAAGNTVAPLRGCPHMCELTLRTHEIYPKVFVLPNGPIVYWKHMTCSKFRGVERKLNTN